MIGKRRWTIVLLMSVWGLILGVASALILHAWGRRSIPLTGAICIGGILAAELASYCAAKCFGFGLVVRPSKDQQRAALTGGAASTPGKSGPSEGPPSAR